MPPQRIPPIQIEIEAEGWRKIRGLKKRLEGAASLTLAALPENLIPAARLAQATLLLTTDGAVKRLNKDFRAKDKPTNVLSFPQFERRELRKLAKAGAPLYVGDIAVAYGVVLKESKAEGKAPLDHLTHLLIHGLLHLFGYDHDTNSKAACMERLEREVMATLGLPNPYAVQVPQDERNRSVKRKR